MKPKNKYELTVHFDEYTGNFHREFNAFVLAYEDEFMLEKNAELVRAGTAAFVKKGQDPDDTMDKLMEYYHHFHDEYGPNISEITQVKNAKGKYECNGIMIFFDKDPTKILPIILKQIEKFPEAARKHDTLVTTKLKILKIEFVKKTITREVINLNE